MACQSDEIAFQMAFLTFLVYIGWILVDETWIFEPDHKWNDGYISFVSQTLKNSSLIVVWE